MVVLAVGAVLAVTLWNRTTRSAARRTTVEVRPPHPASLPRSTPADAAHEPVTVINVDFREGQKTPVDELIEKYDPAADDWDTEFLSDRAEAQLKKLTELIRGIDPRGPAIADADPEAFRTLLTGDFSCSALGGLSLQALREIFNDQTHRVWQLDNSGPHQVTSRSHHGARGLAEALRQLVRALGPGPQVRVKLKLFRIYKIPDGFTTRVHVVASNRSAESGVQQNATWHCHWDFPGTGQKPRLNWIELEAYEQVQIRAAGGTLFTDCTESVLGHTAAYAQQVLRGIDHWLLRLGRFFGTSVLGHHGLALGDVNGDGLEDMYVCNSGGLPNRLFVQNPDGTVADRSSEAGVDWLDMSMSALLVDLDNDGDQDLVVGMPPGILFAENEGQGRFTPRATSYAGPSLMSLCAADYDNDGDLDVYVCGYGAEMDRGGLPLPVPFHDANNGGGNVLLRNDGGFRLVDVTEKTGLDENNSRFSFAAAWDDYDNDGDMDIYVANDFGRNNLYRNDGGRFTDVAADAGVEDIATGMSVSWGDYDRDGLMDVYVGNMFSGAGNRVNYQRRLSETQPDQVVAQMRRMVRGNSLFANAGDDTFRDVSEAASVTMGRWAWSSKFVDLNNDGWQDLVVVNGYVTNEDTGDL